MAPTPLKKNIVGRVEIRKIFNENKILERQQSGELSQQKLESRKPRPFPHYLRKCTLSQIIAYVDENGVKVAEVHQYLQTDGTLGASGIPDPKKVLVGDVLYILSWMQ